MSELVNNKTFILLAKIFSVAFQPILMPIFCLVLILQFGEQLNVFHSKDNILLIYALCIGFTIILPLCIFAVFYWVGWVTDVNLTVRKERVIPTFLSMILFVVFYYLVKNNGHYHPILLPAIFGCLSSTLIAACITIFWKISIHCLGISSVTGTLFGIYYTLNEDFLLLGVLIAIVTLIIGISRVVLKRHTVAQVIAGTALGFLGTFLGIVFDVYV